MRIMQVVLTPDPRVGEGYASKVSIKDPNGVWHILTPNSKGNLDEELQV